jgi:hypothetical protein
MEHKSALLVVFLAFPCSFSILLLFKATRQRSWIAEVRGFSTKDAANGLSVVRCIARDRLV